MRGKHLLPGADHICLLRVRDACKFREMIQRKQPAALCRIDMVTAMHRDRPAILLKLPDNLPEILSGRIDGQRRILRIRHYAKQRSDAMRVEQTLKAQKPVPVHIRRDIIHPDCDFHPHTPLRQNPRMRFCRTRQPVRQHRCCCLKALHQQNFQTYTPCRVLCGTRGRNARMGFLPYRNIGASILCSARRKTNGYLPVRPEYLPP